MDLLVFDGKKEEPNDQKGTEEPQSATVTQEITAAFKQHISDVLSCFSLPRNMWPPSILNSILVNGDNRFFLLRFFEHFPKLGFLKEEVDGLLREPKSHFVSGRYLANVVSVMKKIVNNTGTLGPIDLEVVRELFPLRFGNEWEANEENLRNMHILQHPFNFRFARYIDAYEKGEHGRIYALLNKRRDDLLMKRGTNAIEHLNIPPVFGSDCILPSFIGVHVSGDLQLQNITIPPYPAGFSYSKVQNNLVIDLKTIKTSVGLPKNPNRPEGSYYDYMFSGQWYYEENRIFLKKHPTLIVNNTEIGGDCIIRIPKVEGVNNFRIVMRNVTIGGRLIIEGLEDRRDITIEKLILERIKTTAGIFLGIHASEERIVEAS